MGILHIVFYPIGWHKTNDETIWSFIKICVRSVGLFVVLWALGMPEASQICYDHIFTIFFERHFLRLMKLSVYYVVCAFPHLGLLTWARS